MRTLGIDLAADAKRTAVCSVTWQPGRAVVELPLDALTDVRLLELIGGADKVGIDCPFGWPDPFIKAVSAHAANDIWPGRGKDSAIYRRLLKLPTDR